MKTTTRPPRDSGNVVLGLAMLAIFVTGIGVMVLLLTGVISL